MKNSILIILMALLAVYIIFVSGEFYYFTIPFIVMQIVGLLLIFWAILVKKLYKHPASHIKSKYVYLLKEGPYEFIRYPIYAGILLFLSAYVQDYLTIIKGIAFIIFVVLVIIRIKDDERRNETTFKHEYEEYKKTTKKIIPYLY